MWPIRTKLLQQAQSVKLGPQFYRFPFQDARDDDICNYHLLPSGENTLEIALVGAPCGHEAHHLVIFGNLILDFVMQIGEGSIQQGDEVFESRTVRG